MSQLERWVFKVKDFRQPSLLKKENISGRIRARDNCLEQSLIRRICSGFEDFSRAFSCEKIGTRVGATRTDRNLRSIPRKIIREKLDEGQSRVFFWAMNTTKPICIARKRCQMRLYGYFWKPQGRRRCDAVEVPKKKKSNCRWQVLRSWLFKNVSSD